MTMISPVLLEALSSQLINDRLHQAAQAALAAQLPRPASPRPATAAARQHLASALRHLAAQLDPNINVSADSPLAIAN